DVKVLGACDVVFFATPHGVAHALAGELLAAGTKVIDLSADFRLQDPVEWSKWYNQPHGAPELLDEAVYGLPEVNREKIKGARLIAVPGCYPTATQLGFLPLLESGLADPTRLIADCKSGISGAGRGASVGSLYAETSESFKAYAVKGHRHLPEISQGLRRAAGGDIGLTFVPHLTPMIRGIHATLYSTVVDRSVDLQALFEKRYANEPFVDVMPAGSHPETRSVRGANVCRIAVHRPSSGWRPGGGVVGHRQPRQRRIGPGGAEHEHHVRAGRAHGAVSRRIVALKAASSGKLQAASWKRA
nr:probable N-acetyl-gamma-glutamyl-phosphate reductase, chloroplastic [Tanacetum cinerariifolium]